ncbi:hypothetical protein SAMN05216474_0636 [Lishizhenia tianjinensis]|uniref:Uncharacterized protein n=1 Tax=Lishizhenia tianjinensis TaxID=477690 RepID=A0A1I6Y486_9FLAO|nr:hypothetical protein [Lishizhenia tianjinensis]SFT45061.1 hypothetical protein SAMN05216474_0636 [Lishizhenia tianjinensis]
MKITQIIITILLSLALPLSDIVTLRHSYDFEDDIGPEFYGLPFIYRTEIPWVNSLSGDFYILGYFGNVIFFSLVLVVFTLLIKSIKLNGFIKKLWNVSWMGTSVFLILFAALFFFITEWRFEWTNSEILKHSNQPELGSRTLEFFSTGK